MAVELMMDHHNSFVPPNMQEKAVREAASVGIQTVEEVLNLLKQNHDHQHQHQQQHEEDIKVVTDLAVNSFKRVISLLGRTKRTGHARFRRAPVSPVSSPPAPPPQLQQQRGEERLQEVKQERERKEFHDPIPSSPLLQSLNNSKNNNDNNNSSPKKEPQIVSAFKVYQPTPTHRLPPLPTTANHHHIPHHHQQKANHAALNFSSSSPAISGATSFVSSLTTGETDSVQKSMSSSGFQFTQTFHSKPPLSSSSLKRKCMSTDDTALKCSVAGGSASGSCHCSKKR